jgi:hypothetical protein
MNIDRRHFVSGLAAAGVASLPWSSAAWALPLLAQTEKSNLIDVHHHFVPPFYFSENRE